ncbi:14133_t:CDS:2 [Entrophospora sp. SA101]|nr:14133_t:CDS:2 [Entrophospora sp. SA101]
MAAEFGWSFTTQGLVLSSFLVGYLLTQVIGGILADKFGGKMVLGISAACWNLFTLLTPISAKFGLNYLILCRICLGVGEGAAFPCIHSMIASWIPKQENSRAATIITVGKICCDSEGRLNPESAMLVTSINLGERVIKLFLNDLPSFSLFPGQIIGVEGVNNTGNCLYVKKIYELPLLPFYRSPNQINENDQTLIINDYSSSSSSSKSLEVVFVAGPYTLDTDLTFEPFKELIRKMIKEKPNILVLMGPFVDENHPIIQQGKATMLVDDIFNNNITKYLDVLIKDSPDINVIVIPNPRDVIHEYPIFPQPPFNNRFSKSLIINV